MKILDDNLIFFDNKNKKSITYHLVFDYAHFLDFHSCSRLVFALTIVLDRDTFDETSFFLSWIGGKQQTCENYTAREILVATTCVCLQTLQGHSAGPRLRLPSPWRVALARVTSLGNRSQRRARTERRNRAVRLTDRRSRRQG